MQTCHGPRRALVSRNLVFIIIGALVLGLVISSYFFLFRSGPDLIVRRFLEAQNMGDWATVKTCLSKESLTLLPPDSELPPPPEKPEPLNLEIGKAQIQGARAMVPVKTKGPTIPGMPIGAMEQTTEVVMVKEGGAWKIDLLATMRPQVMPGGMEGGMGPGGEMGPGGMGPGEPMPPSGPPPG